MRIKWTVEGQEWNPKNFIEKFKKQAIDKAIETLGDRVFRNIGKCDEHPENNINVYIDLPLSEFDSGTINGHISIKNVCCEKINTKIEILKSENKLLSE